MKLRELLISKRMLSHKFQTVINKHHDNRKLRQALSRKVTIERNLCAHLKNLIASLKHSKVKMRFAHRRREKKRACSEEK